MTGIIAGLFSSRSPGAWLPAARVLPRIRSVRLGLIGFFVVRIIMSGLVSFPMLAFATLTQIHRWTPGALAVIDLTTVIITEQPACQEKHERIQ